MMAERGSGANLPVIDSFQRPLASITILIMMVGCTQRRYPYISPARLHLRHLIFIHSNVPYYSYCKGMG